MQEPNSPTTQMNDEEPEYKETKLHYYAGIIFLAFALLCLALEFRTSRLLFFEAVKAFREGQALENSGSQAPETLTREAH